MKHFILFPTLFCLLFLGCNSKNNQSSSLDSTLINSEGISVVKDNYAIRILAVTDMENGMSADLFKGSFNDSLLSVLTPQDGQFPSTISSYLIVRGDDIVLVDAGLGNFNGGQLLAKLSFLGISPEKVTAVLLTHLHADHIGGLILKSNNDAAPSQPVFPGAEIYLSVDEFNAWADGGPLAERNGLWKEVLASYANSVRPFMDGDTLLDGLAVAKLTPGHTPGHTVYQVGDILFVGDLFHSEDLQIPFPDFCAKYDGDFPQAVDSRKRLLDYASHGQFGICGAHCCTRPIILTSSNH